MNFLRAIKFSFANPKWWLTSLVVLCTSYVPILGHMVLLGYLSTILESFVHTKNDTYKDFNLNKLVEYFKRGIYPFCTQLIIGLCCIGVLFLIPAIIGISIFAVVDESINDKTVALLVIAGLGLFFIIAIFFSLIINFIIIPATIAAALTQRFHYSFSLKFICGFIKRTWKEFLLVICFYLLLSFVMIPIMIIPGAVLIMYVIMGPLMLMQWHIYWQLYEIYLKKDGKLLPFRG